MLDRTDRHPGLSEPATIRRRTVVSALAVGFVLVAAIASTGATGALAAKPSPSPTSPPQPSLTAFVTDPSPWLHLEPNSQQRSPIYLGSTPRELALGLPPVDGGVATLPASLKALGELQLKNIRQSLIAKKWITAKQTLTVEAWPVRDDRGRFTWAFARWRVGSTIPWRWLGLTDAQNTDPNMFVPELMDPTDPWDHAAIFDDLSQMPGLYYAPLFGDILWVERSADPALAAPIAGWLPTSTRESFGERPDLAGMLALYLPQPARLNGVPITYNLAASDRTITWPKGIKWTAEAAPPGPTPGPVVISSWPADLVSSYRADLLALDGESPAVFPISGRTVTFERKNNLQTENQLADVVAYLEERYAVMGISTWREDFVWRGMTQTNLIAEIPGTDSRLDPLLVADHYDTAFAEDLFQQTGLRFSVPGADDNCSATAALLRMADILRSRSPQRTIWLVHLTGEEFPADDLGARALVSRMLGDDQDVAGLVLLDMIGYADGDVQFQLNPGNQAASLQMASVALDAAADVAPELRPLLEPRYSERSYLYNTDGIIFSENGYPVLLINEHLNYFTKLMREAYHDSTDTSAIIDFDYAVGITKVAIETVARLAGATAA